MVIELKPKSAQLKPLINEFNLLEYEPGSKVSYFAFPQKGSTICVMNNADVKFDEQAAWVTEKKDNFPILLLGKYIKPVQLTYQPIIDELAINFTPLGINYFFGPAFSELAPNPYYQLLNLSEWKVLGPAFFAAATRDDQQAILEDFLIKQLNHKRIEQLEPMEKAVAKLQQDTEVSVTEVANTYGMSIRTFERLFKKYAGCSPVQFRRIIRFRKSLEVRQELKTFETLTEVALESDYYDSSHFGREYRLLTGESPRSFFDSISFQQASKYPYKFV